MFVFIRNLLSSFCIQFLAVLFFIAFYTDPFSSKHFFLGLFVRSFSTQLFFLVVLHLLLLSRTAFSCVGLLSLFWVWLFLRAFSWIFFYRAFLSGSVLSSTPYIGLLCLPRMHAVNSCVRDTWQRLWREDFTHNGKQVVNRLKIP